MPNQETSPGALNRAIQLWHNAVIHALGMLNRIVLNGYVPVRIDLFERATLTDLSLALTRIVNELNLPPRSITTVESLQDQPYSYLVNRLIRLVKYVDGLLELPLKVDHDEVVNELNGSSGEYTIQALIAELQRRTSPDGARVVSGSGAAPGSDPFTGRAEIAYAAGIEEILDGVRAIRRHFNINFNIK